MTNATLSTTSRPAEAASNFIDPTTLPAEYAMRVRGDCLAPAINAGDAVLFDQRQPYGAGDLVGVYLKPGCHEGSTNVGLKRLVMGLMPGTKLPYQASPDSDIVPVLVCEQDNPPRQYTIPADQILAIHRCLGLVPADVALYDPNTGEPEYRRAVSAGWSRRDLLAGAVTILPAGALTMLPALAVEAEHPDAELLDLERQLEALMPELARSNVENDEAFARYCAMRPPYPDERLQWCPRDFHLGLKRPEPLDVWNEHHVRDRRAEGPLSPEAEARLDEIIAIREREEQEAREAAEASGWEQTGEANERLWNAADAIVNRARAIEPQTFEGMAIQARFVAWEAWHTLYSVPEPDLDWEPKVLRSFVEQALRLGGRDFLPRPWEVQS